MEAQLPPTQPHACFPDCPTAHDPCPSPMPHARFWLVTVPSARGHALSLNAPRARTDSAARRAHQLFSRIGPGLQLTLCAHRSKGRWFSDLRAATHYAESAGRCRAPLAAERRVLHPPPPPPPDTPDHRNAMARTRPRVFDSECSGRGEWSRLMKVCRRLTLPRSAHTCTTSTRMRWTGAFTRSRRSAPCRRCRRCCAAHAARRRERSSRCGRTRRRRTTSRAPPSLAARRGSVCAHGSRVCTWRARACFRVRCLLCMQGGACVQGAAGYPLARSVLRCMQAFPAYSTAETPREVVQVHIAYRQPSVPRAAAST